MFFLPQAQPRFKLQPHKIKYQWFKWEIPPKKLHGSLKRAKCKHSSPADIRRIYEKRKKIKNLKTQELQKKIMQFFFSWGNRKDKPWDLKKYKSQSDKETSNTWIRKRLTELKNSFSQHFPFKSPSLWADGFYRDSLHLLLAESEWFEAEF